MQERNSQKPILRAMGLNKCFKISKKETLHAVNDVDFEIFPGETIGLVGESGCGKSTLGRLLMRLLDAESGRVFFEEQEVTNLKEKGLQGFRKNVQIIFQDPFSSLNPKLTVFSMLKEVLDMHRIEKSKNKEKEIVALLETVGIRPEMMHRYPHEFSGGQRQRIVIARALAVKPKVIIADEAVSALDVSVQAQILNLLLTLQKERNLAMLFISHDLSVVRHMSHRVMVMYQGKIVEEIAAKDLLDGSSHPYTQKLLSSVSNPL